MKNFVKKSEMIFWKYHITLHISLRRGFNPNKKRNIRLTDEVNFEIHFGIIGELKFPKNHFTLFR